MDETRRVSNERARAYTDPARDPVTPSTVLAWLERLHAGVAARDEVFVWELLGYRVSRVVPRGVLEEALALVRAPPDSFRAPVVLLRFAYVMHRLIEAGEPLPGADERWTDASAYEESGIAGDRAEEESAQLELRWPGRGSQRSRVGR